MFRFLSASRWFCVSNGKRKNSNAKEKKKTHTHKWLSDAIIREYCIYNRPTQWSDEIVWNLISMHKEQWGTGDRITGTLFPDLNNRYFDTVISLHNNLMNVSYVVPSQYYNLQTMNYTMHLLLFFFFLIIIIDPIDIIISVGKVCRYTICGNSFPTNYQAETRKYSIQLC